MSLKSRDLQQAKKAYSERNVAASRQAHRGHSPEGYHQEHGKYLGSAIYGGLDGVITTFAIVAGVAGASLGSGIVLILGFANLIADGLSMAIGAYLSNKAEQELFEAEKQRELWEIQNFPQGEMDEMIELYTDKGMSEEDAKTIVEVFSRNEEAWLESMMLIELGIVESNDSSVMQGVVTFVSFFVFGFVPLLIFVLVHLMPGLNVNTFFVACLLTGITLFGLGVFKVKMTEQNWMRAGLETLGIGGTAAIAAYLVGVVLGGLSV